MRLVPLIVGIAAAMAGSEARPADLDNMRAVLNAAIAMVDTYNAKKVPDIFASDVI